VSQAMSSIRTAGWMKLICSREAILTLSYNVYCVQMLLFL